MIKDLCFEIIQRCPNNCLFCSSMSDCHKDNTIDFDTIKRTIDFFVFHGGIKEISLSGGEPLLHPNILDIVEYCHNKGIYTTLYISGLIENLKENIQQESDICEIPCEMFMKLKQLGLDKVVFDVQAVDEDVYDVLMGSENNLSKVIKSMTNASKLEIETAIHFVPNKLNVNQFRKVFELAESVGINEVRVLKFVPQGRGRDNKDILLLSDKELNEFLKSCSTIKEETTKLKIGIPLQQHNAHKCTAGFDKIDIRYDGQILPCPAFKDIDLNLLKKNGFKDINIYRNLEDFEFITDASRKIPLCEKINKEHF